MEGEDRQAWRVIQGYVSAQLQSRLVALEAATEVGESDLVLMTAREFVRVSDLARRLFWPEDTPVSRQTHSLRALTSYLQALPNTHVVRTRRFPRVHGDESAHIQILQELIAIGRLSGDLTIRFRQREGRLVMSLTPFDVTRDELAVAMKPAALRYALQHTSLATAYGLVLSRELASQHVSIYITPNCLHVHFRVITQLQLPLQAS